MSFDNDDSLSTLDRIRIERDGGSVREIGTGGTEVRYGSTTGVSDYSRFDSAGKKTDSHTGFDAPPLW